MDDSVRDHLIAALLRRKWKYKTSSVFSTTVSDVIAEFRLEKRKGLYRLALYCNTANQYTPLNGKWGLSQETLKEMYNEVAGKAKKPSEGS